MIIRILKDLNINISWNMIFIGLCTGDVEAYEVIDYAMEQIELGDCRSEILNLREHMQMILIMFYDWFKIYKKIL